MSHMLGKLCVTSLSNKSLYFLIFYLILVCRDCRAVLLSKVIHDIAMTDISQSSTSTSTSTNSKRKLNDPQDQTTNLEDGKNHSDPSPPTSSSSSMPLPKKPRRSYSDEIVKSYSDSVILLKNKHSAIYPNTGILDTHTGDENPDSSSSTSMLMSDRNKLIQKNIMKDFAVKDLFINETVKRITRRQVYEQEELEIGNNAYLLNIYVYLYKYCSSIR